MGSVWPEGVILLYITHNSVYCVNTPLLWRPCKYPFDYIRREALFCVIKSGVCCITFSLSKRYFTRQKHFRNATRIYLIKLF